MEAQGDKHYEALNVRLIGRLTKVFREPEVTSFTLGGKSSAAANKANAATDCTDFSFWLREIRVIGGSFFCFLCLFYNQNGFVSHR